MAQEINKVADALFEKIRSRFEDISLGNDKAEATAKPEDARFFNFNYTSRDGEDFGNVTISLIDNDSLKIYFSKNISEKLDPEQRKEWYDFLQEMRKFARRNLLTFDTRDISRSNLNIKDLKQVSQADSTFTSGDVKVTESRLYGTPKHSFENIGSARIRIVHTESVNPEVRGSRARHINAIYIENVQGERFKMESNKLIGARAMARHISEGGAPYDDIGRHINEMLKEMSDLGVFVRGMRRRTFEDAVATEMMEAAVGHYGDVHRQLHALKGVNAYRKFVENFEPQAQQLDEVDLNDIKEHFVKKIFDDRMTVALPHVYKAYQLQEQSRQAQALTIRNIIEGTSQLTLATNEGMDEYMKMLRFQDTGTLVQTVLEDIANRAVTMPEVSAFASYWAKNYSNINEGSTEKLKEGQALAVQLATHYLRDLRNLKENNNLRVAADTTPAPDANIDLLSEGTWATPDTDEKVQQLAAIMANALPVGVDATNATAALYDIIGDDTLFDNLGELAEIEGPESDARATIKQFIKTEYPGLMEKLGLSDVEFDAPPAQPQQSIVPPVEQPMAANQPPGQSSGGVVSEDLVRMLRIAGILVK